MKKKKKKSNFTCYFNKSLWGINFLFKRYFFIGIILNFNFPFKKNYVTNNLSLHAEAITHAMPYVKDCKPNNNVKYWF